MKYLLLIFSLLFISCEYQIKEQDKINYSNELDKSLYESYYLDFIVDANEFNITLPEQEFKVYLYNQKEQVVCDENNIIIQESKYSEIKEFLSNPPDHMRSNILMVRKSLKALFYKGFALCLLNQEPRNQFNKFNNIVPVPSSLTYKYGVSSSWLINYCYQDNGYGIYPSEEPCDRYYQKSFWDAYLYELFYQDDKFVLEMALEKENQ